MHYTTLGRTGLRVSVAGLGTGGFSRMGLKTGKTEDEAARLVCEAVELGVNFIDTAPPYGTEGVVGRALKSIPRDKVVVATKSTVHRNNEWWTPERVVASLDNSLRLMGTDYVDVFNLHARRSVHVRIRARHAGARASSNSRRRARSGISGSPRIRSSITPTRRSSAR